MKFHSHLFVFFLSVVLYLPCAFTNAQSLQEIPKLTGHVVDNASMISEEQRQSLETYLSDFEKKTGNQLVVLTINKTQPETIEQYSIRVTDTWKLGRKGIDDGVLLLIAPKNPKSLKRLRLETGIGTQGVLTDAQSKQILQEVIAPEFSKKQFYQGIVNGVAQITAVLSKESFPAPKDATQNGDDEAINWPVILGFFFILIIGVIYSKHRKHHSSSGHLGTTGIILGSPWDNPYHGYDDIGSSDDSFSGGGGSFDGGGASGDWDD